MFFKLLIRIKVLYFFLFPFKVDEALLGEGELLNLVFGHVSQVSYHPDEVTLIVVVCDIHVSILNQFLSVFDTRAQILEPLSILVISEQIISMNPHHLALSHTIGPNFIQTRLKMRFKLKVFLLVRFFCQSPVAIVIM